MGSAVRVGRLEQSAPESTGGEVMDGVTHSIGPEAWPAPDSVGIPSPPIPTGLGDEPATVAHALARSIRLV